MKDCFGKSLDFQGFFCVVKAFAFEKPEADSRNSAKKIPSATYELPYEGAKEMLVDENVDDKDFLTALFNAMYEELPLPKPNKKR